MGQLVNRKSADNICLGVNTPNPMPGTIPEVIDCQTNGNDVWVFTNDGKFKHKNSGLCAASKSFKNDAAVSL